jgi:trimethylamine--corrinoid protein Co-methyltransferase
MDEIHLSITPVTTISDLPPLTMVEWITAEQMRNTQKVTAAGVFGGCAPWVIEMALVTDQQVYGQINSISPLTFPDDQIEGGLAYVGAGHPVCILPGPTLGANSPVTLAGTLVQQNAEHLAAVVLLQLFRPGAPVTLASYPHLMDVRDAGLCIGTVEIALLGAALAQIGRRYGIPSHPEFPITDSKCLDQQSAVEKAMTVTLLAEAGVHLISNGGALETEKTWSPAQLVIDDEINAMVGRLLEGFEVNEETLALDVIEEVGHTGNYLDSGHTLRLWRQHQFLPQLADRQSYDAWAAGGSRDMVERARERAREIMENHEVPPLPEDQDRELDRILGAAEAEKLG